MGSMKVLNTLCGLMSKRTIVISPRFICTNTIRPSRLDFSRPVNYHSGLLSINSCSDVTLKGFRDRLSKNGSSFLVIHSTSFSTNTKHGEKMDIDAKETPVTTESTTPPPSVGELSKKDKLKQAVRDYGATVIVFHVTMSLMSLGFFYLLVESGLDVIAVLSKLGISESLLQSKVTEEAGKFVVAYAVHKVFAPLRITITLTATPLIVRKLRAMGILKQIGQKKKQS